jgi:hypothetical protein
MNKDKPKGRKTGSMSRHQKVLIGIAIGFLLYSVAGFWLLPSVLKSVLEKKLAENLNRSVAIEAIQINPYLLRITVNNFRIDKHDRDGHFIAFNRLFMDLEIASVFKRALVVKTLTLNGPSVNLARYKDLTYNFSDLGSSTGEKEDGGAAPLLFSLNNIEITEGSITFFDEPKETTHRVEQLNLAVPFLSTVKHEVEISVEPAFSAIANNTPVKLSGRTIPFHDTRKTIFDIRVMDFNIPDYLAYFPDLGNLALKSGFLDITASLGFEMAPGNQPAIVLNGDVSLREVDIAETGGESYLTIPRVDVTILDSKPLKQDIHLSSISISDPEILLRRNSDGNILPLALFPKSQEGEQDKPGDQDEKTRLKLIVDEITLQSGTLRYNDQANAEQFQTVLNPVEIKINGLSTLEGAEASYDISMRTEAEEAIALSGSLGLNPLITQLHTTLQDLQVPRFSPYYSGIITPKITDGRLNVAADITYAKTDDIQTIKAGNIAASLESLEVDDIDDAKLLTIPSLSIDNSIVDLIEKQLTVGEFSTHDGELHLVRQKDGIVILKELLKPREKTEEKPEATEKNNSTPWTVTLQNGAVSNFSVALQDHVPAEPATLLLDKINLSAENISTTAKSKGDIDLKFRIDKKGNVSIKGPVVIEPLSTSLAIKLSDLQVKTLQPYFADRMNFVIGDGAISLDGKLEVSKDKNKQLATLFSGTSSVSSFSSVDPVAGEDFLRWKNLNLEGMEYDTSQNTFKIREISWQEFYNRIVIFEDGAINLKSILKKQDEPDTSGSPEKAKAEKSTGTGKKLRVEIGSLVLEKGQFDFLDRNITPNYTSSFSELSGTITGLSSQADVMAEVNISGKLDQHAPLLISGRINPLREELFADLIFDFRNIELSPTTPYTGKFIGYTVAKGKLSLDLKYLVEGSKIDGKNEAFLDQFTLGETVDSPEAMNLPINLAISLLKNRKGEITLNVPVKGDLSDPEFSIGGIVFKAIINLIAKAATSPFALLKALIPEGGEELQYVDFSPGNSVIEDKYTSNIETIAKVLYDRPGLKMDIKGNVNAEQERPVLHEKQFLQLLKKEKYKKVSKKKDETLTLDEISIEPDEYAKFLKSAYKEATFEKPKSALGLSKRLPSEEMEKLLRDNIAITDDDLRLLAIERANNVKSYLVENGQIEPERLFIIEPEMGAAEAGSQRVEMIIR